MQTAVIRLRIIPLLCVLIASLAVRAQEPAEPERWIAGEIVPKERIERCGISRCFTQREIDDALFERIYGRSFKADCTTSRSELRYLTVLHVDIEGNIRAGELICHRTIAGELLEIFRTLYDADYPIERMVLIDRYDADDERSMAANNSSAFNFRFISGTTKPSSHSRGLAVDINPLYNPYVVTRNGRTRVEPEAGRPYVDRTAAFPYKIERGDRCCQEFLRHGFVWGGDWRSCKDYQHFEKQLPR